jgi:Uma2 family endonuclease
LLALSERNKPIRFERLANGEIRMMTPVGGVGGEHEIYVSSMLYIWNQSVKSRRTYSPNTGFNLPDGSCLAPDACWIPIEAYQSLTPAQRRGYAPLCPEFIIEIRSQSDSRRLLETKMTLWIENGAKLAWLIDPIDKNVVIYRPGEATETLERPDVVRAHAPVAGFILDAAPLWMQDE